VTEVEGNLKQDIRDFSRIFHHYGSGQGQVAGTCECGNELSGPIKCGEFID